MKINKFDIIKKYTKSRCAEVHYFLDRLKRGYNFPNPDETLYEMVVDFDEYTESDFSASYKILDAMKIYGPMTRSHIRKACEEAKSNRIRKKKLQESPPKLDGCQMPADIKKRIKESLS